MYIVSFIFGLIFGSFLNMLIYRLPLGISLINPKRSICPNCNNTIKWYENIPVISYIFLKGKCANCKENISVVYPVVELITALVTTVLFYKFGFTISFIMNLILFYSLIVLSFIDLQYKAVPDYLLLFSLVFAMFIDEFSFYGCFIFAGGFVLLDFFITFYIQNIKARFTKNDILQTQKALGEGDIPIVAIIGGILGIKLALVAVFLSAIFAILPAIYYAIKKDEIQTPFIPFLTLGFFVVYILDIKLEKIF